MMLPLCVGDVLAESELREYDSFRHCRCDDVRPQTPPTPLDICDTMFELLDNAPPDAILGLNEAFRDDPNPDKINLSVGVYKDAAGTTPVLSCVKEAEKRLLESQQTKSYLGIDGIPQYGQAVRELVFGPEHEVVKTGRAATLQTPGGTGALRVAADFIRAKFPSATIWTSNPTWANHPAIFSAAGLPVETYPYLNADKTGLDFDNMLAGLKQTSSGDVVLLHGCCHNPTGVDMSLEQWRQVGELIRERNCLPLVDFAYQGFGTGVQEDAAGLHALCTPGTEFLLCTSFSKNFGLYSERVGALSLVAGDAAAAAAALSHAKLCVRRNYSNPPQHGGAIVVEVLADPQLRQQWEQELADMRSRILAMRSLFVETMRHEAPNHDFSFITQQRGMFSFSGLSPLQVDELRQKHSIYIVGSGRINVAGMTEENMDTLCTAIGTVL